LLERRFKRERLREEAPYSIKALQRDLHLKRPPRRIEAVDISTIQGSDAVGSLVYFVDGRPRKSEYRRYRIKTVEGQDDFAMMKEVVSRRFGRLLEEGRELPDLLLVDGGKGQLSSALEALRELGIEDQPVVGLAKRLEEVYLPGIPEPQNIPKGSASLRLLQQIRDEAHRFAVEFHRKLRSKRTLTSELDSIPGLGKVRKEALLERFGSVRSIREAPPEDLQEVPGIGPKLARKVLEHLRGEDAS
ncbi:MAG TPA: excinuclease ABC subunit C, partial [Candidatus Latescibacteria bacterium]|nr:excinuclease ABC subunit C [Candidatus Latescibacterota bacterium]